MPPSPPPGDYANSCVGREQAFRYGSQRHGTPGRLMRLEYSIDMRYGVLHDIAHKVFAGEPVDVTMGHVNVIWQGDANEQALRRLAHECGRRFGKEARVTGAEAPTAWLVDTAMARRILGPPRVPLATLVDWQADWIARGLPSLGKPTHFETRDGRY